MNKITFGIKKFSKHEASPFKTQSAPGTEAILMSKTEFSKLVGLSKTSLKVLNYLITGNRSDLNGVYFNLGECRRFTGLKGKRSVYNAITELLGVGIIARSNSENRYFLNESVLKVHSMQSETE